VDCDKIVSRFDATGADSCEFNAAEVWLGTADDTRCEEYKQQGERLAGTTT
jgi:hypothetical protein